MSKESGQQNDNLFLLVSVFVRSEPNIRHYRHLGVADATYHMHCLINRLVDNFSRRCFSSRCYRSQGQKCRHVAFRDSHSFVNEEKRKRLEG